MQNGQISFSFLVLAYNHERYIIDHLESIKYQIEQYGNDIAVDLLINDDGSSDMTVMLIEKWLHFNEKLFRRIVLNFNKSNKGTCACVVDLFYAIKTQYFKLTAGDDIYSFENIFCAATLYDNAAFISGFPLYLDKGVLKESFLSNVFLVATNVIYSVKGIRKQFVNFSFNNAPNMFYNRLFCKDIRVIDYLKKFDVTEDWPLQISISRYFPNNEIKYINKVLVYYRRTEGSTYIVANSRFYNDKIKIFNDLIDNSTSFFERLRVKSRMLSFKFGKYSFSKIINIDLYIFFFFFILRFAKFIRIFLKLNFDVNKHVLHLDLIRSRTEVFLKKNNLL